MKYKSFLLIGLTLVLVKNTWAQSDFDKWYKEHQAKFTQYLSEEDKKFAEFLKEEWKRFNLFEGVKRDTVPKPLEIPVYKPEVRPDIEEEPETDIPEAPQPIDDIPAEEDLPRTDDTPPYDKPVEKDIPTVADIPGIDYSRLPIKTEFDFYGQSKNFNYSNDFKIYLNDVSGDEIAKFWTLLSSKDYTPIIQQITHHKETMSLNDWGYIQLLKGLAENLYPKQRNEKHLFVWYFLLKSGYQVKVGYFNKDVYIFFPSKHNIYDWSYLKANDNHPRLYILDLDNLNKRKSGSLFTYDKDYPGADKVLDMGINKFPKISTEYATKKLKWDLNYKKYEIDVDYNMGFIKFTKDYPFSDFSIYFNSEVSPGFKSNIVLKVKELVDGLPEKEASDLILALVQKSFKYQTDGPQFGREKPLFAEETIHYPFSDCEDRAVLFSFLIRKVIGLKVVGVDYPGHIATAVLFNEYKEGSKINYRGDTYTICDPTYIGATSGMEMPGYRNQEKKIIEIY